MAELNVEDAQRLARLFLTGQAGDAEVQRLQNALADDQGAALELLSQMQAALDDSAPAGLNAEQDRSVNGRIEALIAPRVKKRGFLAFFLKFFRSKPQPTEDESQSKSRRRRRGGAAEPEPTPVVETAPNSTSSGQAGDLGETLPGGDGMEEMAPIAAPSAAAPSDAAPRPAPARVARASAPAAKRGLPKWLLPAILILLVGGLAAYGVRWFLQRPKPVKPVVVAVPTPQPTPSPTPNGRGHRSIVVGVPDNEALPAKLPSMTPVTAGQVVP